MPRTGAPLRALTASVNPSSGLAACALGPAFSMEKSRSNMASLVERERGAESRASRRFSRPAAGDIDWLTERERPRRGARARLVGAFQNAKITIAERRFARGPHA